MKKLVQRIFVVALSLVMCIPTALTCFAAEPSTGQVTSDVSITSSESVQPRGVLSGYAGFNYVEGVTPYIGEFTIEVTGSWSAFAGLTVKTSGFDPALSNGEETALVILSRPDGSVIHEGVYLGPNDEVKNKALFNVPTGTYTVTYMLSTVSNGRIDVWIY